MDNFKSKFKKLSTAKKVQFIFASLASATVMVALPVAAWFAHQNELAMLTKVNSPAKLYINAATHKEDIINLSLSDIDTEETGINYQEFVFCVAGENVSSYDIQIAHTTNIAFTYEVFPATEIIPAANETITPVRGSIVQYISEDKSTNYFYSYNSNNSVEGSYLNQDEEIVNRNVASDDYTKTKKDDHIDYDKGYETPQIFAKALYWQNSDPISVELTDENSKKFEHAYILKVSWSQEGQNNINAEDDAIDFVHNNKETDIVYITAEVH